jgi:invasion protein IalB
MNWLLRTALIWLSPAIIVAGTVHAQSPQRTTATYDDWTVSCAVTAGEKSCELAQSQSPQGQTSPISQITIGRVAKNEPLRIIFQVASNVWLQAGVKVLIDEKEPLLSAAFRWCIPTRCLADADLTDAYIKKLNGRNESLHLSWKNVSQSDVTIPVSLRGFSAALDAMQMQTSTSSSNTGDVRRFDGQWSTEAECQAVSPNVLKNILKTISKIENGKLSAKFGDDGKPGSGRFEGVINTNGNIELSVNGLTGDSKYYVTNPPEKTPYTWRATGILSGSRGAATRTEGQACKINFSKN